VFGIGKSLPCRKMVLEPPIPEAAAIPALRYEV
jgi:hypothetical protein